MKILFLLILISFIVSCKNFKKTSAIKEEETSHPFINRDIIKKLIDIDEQLNSKRQKFNDSLLTDTNYYKDTFAIYLDSCLTNGRIKGSEFRDIIVYFTNYISGDNKRRIVVYTDHKRNIGLEKFVYEYIFKTFGSFKKNSGYIYLDYFQYDNYYYVKYYYVFENIAFLEKIYIIQNNKILYLNLMPSLGLEKNFQTPEEHFQFEREVMLDELPDDIITDSVEE